MNFECHECEDYICGDWHMAEHARLKHPGSMVVFTEWDMDLFECEIELEKEFSGASR